MNCHKFLSFLWKSHHDYVLYLRQVILLFSMFLQNWSRMSAVLIVLELLTCWKNTIVFQTSTMFGNEYEYQYCSATSTLFGNKYIIRQGIC